MCFSGHALCRNCQPCNACRPRRPVPSRAVQCRPVHCTAHRSNALLRNAHLHDPNGRGIGCPQRLVLCHACRAEICRLLGRRLLQQRRCRSAARRSAARKIAADHCPCVRWMHHFVELVNGVVRVGAVLARLRLDEPPAELDVPAIGPQRCPTHGNTRGGMTTQRRLQGKARQGKAVPRERTPTCALSMRHYRYECSSTHAGSDGSTKLSDEYSADGPAGTGPPTGGYRAHTPAPSYWYAACVSQ
jgi:hypothetical protein